MENILIQIFNHPSRNGRIYIADSKEDVLKVFGGFIEENKSSLLLTRNNQSFDLDAGPEESPEDHFKRLATINLQHTVGIFKDIEIIETGDIGYNEKPIFEVRGNLNFLENNPDSIMVKELLKENVCSIGMRAIEKVICFDLINK